MTSTALLWRGLALAVVVVAFSISAYHRRRADRRGGQVPRSADPLGIRLLIGTLMLGTLGLVVVYVAVPGWLPWALLDLPGWVSWLGIVGAGLDLALVWWTLSTLGANITATHATREDHALVTEGPYRYVCHPLYTSGILLWLVLFLITGLWPLLLVLVGIWAMLLWRTPMEEAALRERFGAAYEAYEARTGRFLPRLRGP